MFPNLQGSYNLGGTYNPQQSNGNLQVTAPGSRIQNAPNLVQPNQGYHLTGVSTPNAGVLGASTTRAAAPAAPAPLTAQQIQQNALMSALPGQLSQIQKSGWDASNNSAHAYQSSILDLLDSLRQQQTGINNQSVQNELARTQGTQGVLGMVGRGIQSGGVLLGNKNAGSSSAVEALARAYGTLGRQQQTGVNNQYAQGQNAIQQAQDAFSLQSAQGTRHLAEGKQSSIDTIVQAAQQQLNSLNNSLVNASLPDRINIEQEKERVRTSAMNALNQFDQTLSQGVAGITPASQDQNRISAQQLATAGVAPTTQFDYTSSIPAQFQNTGPFASSLPLFTLPTNKKVTA